jgi:hypothetical protein
MARSVSNTGARIQVWGTAMPGGFLEERIRRILEGGPLPRLSRARLVGACIACAATSAAFATSTLDHQRPARQPDRQVALAQSQANSSNGNPAVNPLLAQRQQQSPTGLPAAGAPSGDILSDAPRKLHVEIQGLPAEAAAELRQRLALREGETFDGAALAKELERIHQIVTEFDPNLSDKRMMAKAPRNVGADGKVLPPDSMDVTLIILPRDSTPQPSGTSLSDVPRRLHVDIQGLSDEAAAELRQRLALREGEVFDHAAFVKELERIHQIVSEFDPHLNDSRAVGKVARKTGADGKALPPDSMDVTVIIAPRDSAPQGELQQYTKILKPPSFENVPVKLHFDIQGLSPQVAAKLRQLLAVQEGETTDLESLKKAVVRIRQVMKEIDPRLKDEMNIDYRSCAFGSDGKPSSPCTGEATMMIKLVDAAP